MKPPSTFQAIQEQWRHWRAHPAAQRMAHNMGWWGLDKVARSIVSFVIGAWVARHLQPADYGVLNYALAIIALVGVLPGLGLDSAVRRELVREPAHRDRWLGTAFYLRLLAGIAGYGIVLALMLFWETDPRARFIVLLNALSLIQASTLVFDFWFQAQLRSKFTVLAQNIAFLLSSAGRVLLIVNDADLESFAILLLLDLPLTTGLLWYFYRRDGGSVGVWRWDGACARQLLRECWPLALSSITVLVYMRIDQVMLKYLAGDAETGCYAAAVRVAEIWHFLPVTLTLTLAPRLVRAREKGQIDYELRVRQSLSFITLVCWAVTLPTMVLGPWLTRTAFGESYAGAGLMLVLLAASLPFIALGVVRREFLVLEGATRLQLTATTLGAALNLALNFFMIPVWGGVGAAASTLASHIVTDLLVSFASAQTRRFGFWQIEALVTPWRPLLSLVAGRPHS